MGRRAGEFNNACLRSSCAAFCSRSNSKGTLLRVNLTNGLARFAKCRMNIRQTPMVPRNARTSETLLQGPHLVILSRYFGSGNRPWEVQRYPTAMISLAHKVDLKPL